MDSANVYPRVKYGNCYIYIRKNKVKRSLYGYRMNIIIERGNLF